MKSWKTTAAGILTLVGCVATAGLLALKGQYEAAIAALSTGIPSGIGLIAARDNDKSSEAVNAK
jgi:hypothetical protein